MGANLLSPNGGNRKFGYRPPVSDINVTPFVDVMLVLLVIFMVAAPMMTQGIQVNLPEVENAPVPEKDDPLEVTVKSNGNVQLQGRDVPMDKLQPRLQAIQNARPDVPVILKADKTVPYGVVMQVMSDLQAAGLTDVGMITEPPK